MHFLRIESSPAIKRPTLSVANGTYNVTQMAALCLAINFATVTWTTRVARLTGKGNISKGRF